MPIAVNHHEINVIAKIQPKPTIKELTRLIKTFVLADFGMSLLSIEIKSANADTADIAMHNAPTLKRKSATPITSPAFLAS